MDAAVVVVDEDPEVVVVHEVAVEAAMEAIEEDSTALPVLARMIAATNGPEAVAVGSQHLKN